MASVKLRHIYKVYPNGAKAVNDFSMDIEDKEFIVFVGPSGCGKSTTLRMIAGLEQITSGELSIDGTVVNYVEPRNRDIAMVFQNYALYPHMTVYDNMAFSLRIHKLPKDEIDRRVKNAAEILGITEYLQRKPKAMSGGQCQRVALGRAIVREPKVFLLDEPLSNLDAKLRTAMRSEISKLHNKLGTTFIYVTHDQVEAMTMGTRIVVMKAGCIQQIDTPSNLYKFPGNKFVAGFIGSPQMNFYEGTLKRNGDNVEVVADGVGEWSVPYEYFKKADVKYLDGTTKLILGIRAEHISVDPLKYPYKARCCVSYTEELGTECLVYADFNVESADSIAETPTRVIIKAPAETQFERDAIIDISVDLAFLQAFDKDSENNIAPRIPQEVLTEGEVKDGELAFLGTVAKLPPAMSVADGRYAVTIPTGAVKVGGEIKAQYLTKENINGRELSHFKVENTYLFGLDLPDRDGKTVSLGIDLKQITLSDELGVKISPIAAYNALDGKFIRKKIKETVEVDGKQKTVKKTVHVFEVAGVEFACPENTASRLVADGKSIYKTELEFRFTPEHATVGETGIPVQTEEILDYGDEKFVNCKSGERELTVKIDSSEIPRDISLAPNTEKLKIIDKKRDIRLI